MPQGEIVLDKSYAFAIRIVKLYVHLRSKKEFHLSSQIVRSGTSIGANIEEAQGGSTKKDFRAKLEIAYKEARETHFWLKLLRDTNFLEPRIAHSLIKDCHELLKLLTAILKTIKKDVDSHPRP